MKILNKVLAVIIAVSGIAGLSFTFVDVSQNIQDIDAGLFILSLCGFCLIETVKRKKHLFTVLIGLIAIIFIVGLFVSF